MTPVAAARRLPIARPATAWLLGGLLLALAIAAVPLSRLAHQSLNSSGGSVPVWVSAAYGAVGVIIASRKPGSPLGWIFLAEGVFGALSEDASFYVVPAGAAVAGRTGHAGAAQARAATAALPALGGGRGRVPGH